MKQTFIGNEMSQEWQDLHIWEQFFKTCEIKTFVELGTGNGGMSLFFALQCLNRGIEFHTFDNQRFFDFVNGLAGQIHLERAFHFVDLFSEEGKIQVYNIIENSPHPMAFFMDDGDKPREWKMFAHLLKPGDYSIVHDWGTEFFEKDLLDVPVERILTDLCDARVDGWKAMWFKRI